MKKTLIILVLLLVGFPVSAYEYKSLGIRFDLPDDFLVLTQTTYKQIHNLQKSSQIEEIDFNYIESILNKLDEITSSNVDFDIEYFIYDPFLILPGPNFFENFSIMRVKNKYIKINVDERCKSTKQQEQNVWGDNYLGMMECKGSNIPSNGKSRIYHRSGMKVFGETHQVMIYVFHLNDSLYTVSLGCRKRYCDDLSYKFNNIVASMR